MTPITLALPAGYFSGFELALAIGGHVCHWQDTGREHRYYADNTCTTTADAQQPYLVKREQVCYVCGAKRLVM